jgi:hypothetical protein
MRPLRRMVHEGHIDAPKSASCGEISATRERIYREGYARMAPCEEIAARYGVDCVPRSSSPPRDVAAAAYSLTSIHVPPTNNRAART